MKPEEVRWGILGCASIAREAFVPAIQRAGDAGIVRAVASRDLSRARAFASELGIPRAFGSYGDLIRSGEIDAVYVALPNSMHAEWSIACLEAGLAVLCEKPLALSLSEGRAMAAAARKAGRPLAEAFMYRYHPWVPTVRGLLAEGRIGAIRSLHGAFCFRLDDEGAIPASEALGGGALRDVGCYPVDAFQRVLGPPPLQAAAMEHRRGVDRVLAGLLRFPGPVIGVLECAIDAFERHEFRVVGTAGLVEVDRPWVQGDAPVRLAVHRQDRDPEVIEVPPADTYALEARDLAVALATGASPAFPLDDSLWTLSAIDALFRSAASGAACPVAGP